MTRLLLSLVALSSLASAVFLGLLLRQGMADRDRLYRASRIYIVAADSLETRLRWAEGRYSQCAAYGF